MATFKAMISAVFVLFIGMIMYSVLAPELQNANQEVAKQDPTGMASKTLDSANSVPDPKGDIKQGVGGFLLNLLNNNPILFIILVLITAGILVALGVTIAQVKGF